MVTDLGQMLLDATITFLNFGLAKAEGFQRGFQSKEQGLVPIFRINLALGTMAIEFRSRVARAEAPKRALGAFLPDPAPASWRHWRHNHFIRRQIDICAAVITQGEVLLLVTQFCDMPQ